MREKMPLEISCCTRPRASRAESGYRCGWWASSSRIVMAIADGKGHGPDAAYAAEVAMACIGAGFERSFDEIFEACDVRLRGTTGVALAVSIVDTDSEQVTMALVGDIRTVLSTKKKDLLLRSTRGIVGHGYEKLQPGTKILSSGDVLALFSDGMNACFALHKMLESEPLYSSDLARIVLERWSSVDTAAAVVIYRHQT